MMEQKTICILKTKGRWNHHMFKHYGNRGKSVVSVVLTLIFLFFLTPIGAVSVSAEDGVPIDNEFAETRETFFAQLVKNTSSMNLEAVNIDLSRIIHVPQEYEEPLPPKSPFGPQSAQEPIYAGPFTIGDTRPFRVQVAALRSDDKIILANLIAQGDHTNIWVLDKTNFLTVLPGATIAAENLDKIDSELAQNIADTFDKIYDRMTDSNTGFAAHTNVSIKPGSGNVPEIGDLGNDGKINFVLYDIASDGSDLPLQVNQSYRAGFFWSTDFYSYSTSTGPKLNENDQNAYTNAIDMLHIDIGKNQGFETLSGDENDKLSIYSTLAHEFQHMLFYMYYGIYPPTSGYNSERPGSENDYDNASDSWINESLSQFAAAYYTKPGAEVIDFSELARAVQNSYGSGSIYRDFFNHGGSKSYDMESLFSMLMYRAYGFSYANNIYDDLKSTYPPANNASERAANQGKILSMQQAIGDFLKAGTGDSIGDGGLDTITKLYFLFMESFAADGGAIHSDSTVNSTKLRIGTDPIDNLWAIRPVLGVSNGRVYVTGSNGPAYSMDELTAISEIANGGTISLNGYGTTNAYGVSISSAMNATHEMLYKLTGNNEIDSALTISIPDDGNSGTKYYAVVPNDTVTTGTYTYVSGASGADIYPLTEGTAKYIDTNGKPAYLFVATLYQDVDNTVTYSWGAPDTAAPTAGDGGTIATDDVADTSLTLNWTAATDNVSAPEDLKYYVYQSSNNNIGTAADCESSGTLLNSGGTATITTYNVTGLNASTAYFFNVVVEDAAGNKMAYNVKEQATSDDNAVISGAKSLIQGAAYTTTQTATADEAAALSYIENVIAGLSTGTTNTVTKVSYTAPTAGTVEATNGTPGSYVFTVAINKGAGTQQETNQLTLTITATAYDASGDNDAIASAKSLIQGAAYTTTQAVTADEAAALSYIENVIAGLSTDTTNTVTKVDYTAPIAGTVGATSGTPGSYV
ncbi:MAG: fibronectin type III domain-containing protein, partial [Peptococcaceae bacterium]|nr:fibronectin type III domain-containing protein [Peptococcaceae bacterium]